MYSPEIIVCSSWTPDIKTSTPQNFHPKFALEIWVSKNFPVWSQYWILWVLPDYRSLKDFKRFLTHFDSMSVYSDRSRWGREFVVSSQFVKILELSTWALKLRTDMVQSHWGGGNIHKWYRHTSGGVVGHINPIFCLRAFVMILKCGTVVVAVTSNLHSHWCQQLFQEKKKCNLAI